MTTQIVEYQVNAETIREWGAKFAGLTCDNAEGYEETRKAIAVLRSTRTGIEKRRKELNADALAWQREVNRVAEELTQAIEPIEAGLKAKKAVVDEERERIKREKEAAEKAAVEAEIRAKREAEEAALRAQREAEEARLAAEREAHRIEAERLAAERAAFEAEQAKIAAAQRAEAERLERERAAEAHRVAKERAALEAERRAVEDAKRAAEHAEALRQAKIAAEAEALARAAREKREAEEARVKEAERQAELAARLEALKPDAEKLAAFAKKIRALKAPEVATDEARNWLVGVMGKLGAAVELCEDFASDGAEAAE